MDPVNGIDGEGTSPVNYIRIADFDAVKYPWEFPGVPSDIKPFASDGPSLAKVQSVGLDVDSLDECHERYNISPLRWPNDIQRLLGYERNISDRKTSLPVFNNSLVTALALPYPNPEKRGELLSVRQMVRIRYPSSEGRIGVGGSRRYEQPRHDKDRSMSEPYYLPVPAIHDRIFDPNYPLIITEGELKAACLNLAGFAAIGFGGVEMWRAPKKAGKGVLHYGLDPEGPRGGKTIPVLDRVVYLLPDTDHRANMAVRRAFRELAKALINVGVSGVFIADIPVPGANQKWKDIDEYIFAHCGPRWSGDADRVVTAHALVQGLLDGANYVRSADRYLGTDPVRGAERIYSSSFGEGRYTAVGCTQTSMGETCEVGWLTYQGDRYTHESMVMSSGSSGKFTSPGVAWRKLAEDDWERGIDITIHEGPPEKWQPRGMPNDYPNRVFAILDQRLPRHIMDTVIEPFEGVNVGDQCVRIRNGLVNMTKYFETRGDWGRRAEWLLPPNHRWFGSGQLGVSLRGVDQKPNCLEFKNMLRTVFDGDQESIDTLQLFLGKIVCCPMFYGRQQFLSLYGAAGSGKGTICRLITDMIGISNTISLRCRGGSSRFETGNLPGKKLVLFEEADSVFDPHMSDVVKNITGMDQVVCEMKGQQQRSVRVEAEVVIVGNNPPNIPMHAGAYTRRAVFLRFAKPIPVRDDAVEKKMRYEELPGIFLWALEGAMRLNDGVRITTPGVAVDDRDEMVQDVSPAQWFVRSELEITEEKAPDGKLLRLTGEQLLDRYVAWAASKHFHVSVNDRRSLLRHVRDILGVKFETHRVPKGEPLRAAWGLKFKHTGLSGHM